MNSTYLITYKNYITFRTHQAKKETLYQTINRSLFSYACNVLHQDVFRPQEMFRYIIKEKFFCFTRKTITHL